MTLTHGAGFRHWPGVVPDADVVVLRRIAGELGSAGERLPSEHPLLLHALPWMLPVAAASLTADAAAPRQVRAVLFDKTPANNWAVPWHQDRTIAVASRTPAPGFGPWSIKNAVQHVEPPFDILAAMVTLRLHLDDCSVENAPLVVASGSHGQRTASSEAFARANANPQQVCLAAAGDIWAYATPILHRSNKAARPTRRRVLQVDFAGDDLPFGLRWVA